MMIGSWRKIENLLASGDNQKFYDFITREAENNELTYIDEILKLRLILIGLPCESRYEVFKLSKIQTILNNFNAKDIVELYEIFPPQDSWQFLESELVKSRLKTLSLDKKDREDIISYFPVETKDSIRAYLNAHLARPLFSWNPVYALNQQDNQNILDGESSDDGYRPGGEYTR